MSTNTKTIVAEEIGLARVEVEITKYIQLISVFANVFSSVFPSVFANVFSSVFSCVSQSVFEV